MKISNHKFFRELAEFFSESCFLAVADLIGQTKKLILYFNQTKNQSIQYKITVLQKCKKKKN